MADSEPNGVPVTWLSVGYLAQMPGWKEMIGKPAYVFLFQILLYH